MNTIDDDDEDDVERARFLHFFQRDINSNAI